MKVQLRWLLRTGLAVIAGVLLAACATAPPRIADHREAEALSDQGLDLMNAGDNAGAIKLLDRVIAYNGGDVRDLTRRATAYAALDRNDAALRDLDRAIQLAPDRWRTYLLRAVTHQKIGGYDAAIHDLDLALVLNANDPELVRRRGYLNLVTSHFERALGDYDHLLEMLPNSGIGPFGRGVSLYLAGNWPAAIVEFDRQLGAAPKDGVAALWLVKSSLRNHAPLAWEQFADRAGPAPEWVMIRALLDEESPDDVLREVAALRKPVTDHRTVGACEADLFLGTWADLKGHEDIARTNLDSARRSCPADSIENAEAGTALARLQRTRG